jgi:hypothetical protein
VNTRKEGKEKTVLACTLRVACVESSRPARRSTASATTGFNGSDAPVSFAAAAHAASTTASA